MSRSCHSGTSSRPTSAFAAQHPRQAGDALAGDRVALVRHRRGALLARRRTAPRPRAPRCAAGGGSRSRCGRATSRAARSPAAARRGGRAATTCVATGSTASSEPRQRELLDARVDVAVGADRARELADAHALERGGEPLAAAVELLDPAEQLEPERHRLGVDAVRAAHAGGRAVLLGPRQRASRARSTPASSSRAGVAELQRQRGVDDVRRRQAVVEPARVLADLLGDRLRERDDVVVRAPLDLARARRRRRARRRGSRPTASGGTTPSSAQASSAASSTSSQRREAPLVRPDGPQVRTGVAGDHGVDRVAEGPAGAGSGATGRRARRAGRRWPAPPAGGGRSARRRGPTAGCRGGSASTSSVAPSSVERVVAPRQARLGGVAAPPGPRREHPADLEAGPALRLPQARPADERAGRPLDERLLAVAAQLRVAEEDGDLAPGAVAAQRARRCRGSGTPRARPRSPRTRRGRPRTKGRIARRSVCSVATPACCPPRPQSGCSRRPSMPPATVTTCPVT